MGDANNNKSGYKNERLYSVWRSMKSRCEKENSPSYCWYGAKGVTVCDEWQDYFTFREWAYSHGYDDKAPRGECTIDRIDPYGNYEPSNCRFADAKTQAKNTRRNWANGKSDSTKKARSKKRGAVLMRNLAVERYRVGIDQRELADIVGVSARTIWAWENRLSNPMASHLVAMSKLFGCSIDYLLGMTEERNIR